MNKGLALKIYNVMCATASLEKDLTVGKGNNSYKAIGEKAVLNMLKPLLKTEKLIIIPKDGEITEDVIEYTNSYDKPALRAVTKLKCYFTIVDVETGESVDIVGFGNGADSQDKGSGKAFTYAFKTALNKTFMMFSGEDTDNTHSNDIGKDKEPVPTKIDCTDLINEGFKRGFDAKAIEKSLIKNYKHGMEFITQAEHDKTLKNLISLPIKG